jgi:hypothetical protein
MRLVRLTLALSLVGCASSTVIHSDPPGATLYVNESLVGFTPYSYTDRRPALSTVRLRLQKDGYEPLEVTLSRNETIEVGNVIGGAMFLWPAFWFMGYEPVHTYVLKPSRELPPADWLEDVQPEDPEDEESSPLSP